MKTVKQKYETLLLKLSFMVQSGRKKSAPTLEKLSAFLRISNKNKRLKLKNNGQKNEPINKKPLKQKTIIPKKRHKVLKNNVIKQKNTAKQANK